MSVGGAKLLQGNNKRQWYCCSYEYGKDQSCPARMYIDSLPNGSTLQLLTVFHTAHPFPKKARLTAEAPGIIVWEY